MDAGWTTARTQDACAPSPATEGGLKIFATLLVAAATFAATPAQAGSAEAGQGKVQSKGCMTCHGMDGQGTDPLFPNLAGQSELYLEQQLKAFRSGERAAPQMSIIAKNLSDEDIADLAAYYAGLMPCGQ